MFNKWHTAQVPCVGEDFAHTIFIDLVYPNMIFGVFQTAGERLLSSSFSELQSMEEMQDG